MDKLEKTVGKQDKDVSKILSIKSKTKKLKRERHFQRNSAIEDNQGIESEEQALKIYDKLQHIIEDFKKKYAVKTNIFKEKEDIK